MDIDGVGRPTISFRASLPELVASRDDRRAAGLHHWIDGTMGIVRHDGRTLVVAPNGRNMSRHVVAAGGRLVEGVVDADQPILGCPPDVAHASGGPLFRDGGTGALVVVYHGETFVDGDHERFFSFLGLAVSTDDGNTFRDVGRILTSDLPETDMSNRPLELGPGAAVRVGEYLYVYFTERTIGSQRLRLGVARARFDDVVDAALRPETPDFRKFHAGAFGSPGLGGPAAELIDNPSLYVGWFDVAHLAEPDLMLLVFSTVPRAQAGDHRWFHFAAWSRDGLSWSEPVPLYGEGVDGEMLYLTLDSGGPEQRRIDAREFDLYRVTATTPYRWDDAWVERVRVSWEPSAPHREPWTGEHRRRADGAIAPR